MNPLVSRVGERVRAVRLARGLSLTALAEVAGVGKGSLSELENGVRNPTLATLYALAAPLGVPLATLLDDTAGAVVADEGVTVVLLETRRTEASVREVYALDLDPGAVRTSSAHGPGVVEHVLVTAGALEAGRTGEGAALAAGEHHTWASDVEHAYRAGPRGAAAVLTILTPVRS